MILLIALMFLMFSRRENFTSFSEQSDCTNGCTFNPASMVDKGYTTSRSTARECQKLASENDENKSFAFNENTKTCLIYNSHISSTNISNDSIGDWVVKNKLDGKIYTNHLANKDLIDIAEPTDMPAADMCRQACDLDKDCRVSVYTNKKCTLKKTDDGEFMKPKQAANRKSVVYIKTPK